MGKTRMGAVDIQIQIASFNERLRGAKVVNIYDSQKGRTYIFKLAVPPFRSSRRSEQTDTHAHNSDIEKQKLGGDEEARDVTGTKDIFDSWQRLLLLVESGVRAHITEFDREKDVPSGFCLKLRKHIRAKRLDSVSQLSGDRILDFTFSGGGTVVAHVIVELFSGGNVILTDADYSILALLRAYQRQQGSGDSAVLSVRERYPVENARPTRSLSLEVFENAVSTAISQLPTAEEIGNSSGRGAKRKITSRTAIRKRLAGLLKIEPALLEHALVSQGMDIDSHLSMLDGNIELQRSLFESLEDVNAALESLTNSRERNVPGYLFISEIVEKDGKKTERYDDFSPFLFAQHKNRTAKTFSSFDEAVDEYFASLEAARAAAAQSKREAAAYKKVGRLENELRGQVSALESTRDKSWEKAQAIESNIVEVDAAIAVIQSALNASIPWEGLDRMIQEEKLNGNPIAEIIHSLNLEQNRITLMLEDSFGIEDSAPSDMERECGESGESGDEMSDEGEYSVESDEDVRISPHAQTHRRKLKLSQSAETRKALLVDVLLDQSAYANARRYYEMRKVALTKMEKAVKATDRTLKAATKKAAAEAHRMEAEAVAASIRARRKANWFEKYHWFVSSENYLVVAGRDSQQSELLIKRCMGPSDVYVHSDVEGSASVIVKNFIRPGASNYSEIPRSTLEQAGTFALCRSAAWDSKIVTSAWWVRATQVSKTTATGEELPVGTFFVRGKKNFLDPSQLTMGFAFLFKIDEENIVSIRGERGTRFELLDGREEEDVVPDKQQNPVESIDLGAMAISGQTPPHSLGSSSGKMENAEESSKTTTDNSSEITTMIENADEHDHVDDLCVEKDVSDISDPSTSAGTSAYSVKNSKRHMSAKERRLLRNGKQSSSSQDANASSNIGEVKDSSKVTKGKKGDSEQKSVHPRGRKHRLKKMKKYEDQDDEERMLALTALGSKPMKIALTSQRSENSEDNCESDADGQSDNDSRTEDRTGSLEQRHRPQRIERMRLLDPDGLAELSRLESESVRIVNMLTATPHSSDDVEYALPVCAPYSALSGYRYRAKLVPGGTKRGKAYRSVAALFLRQAERDLAERKLERDAMRIVPESDSIQNMLGSVRIMAPGLAEAQKAVQKIGKKGSASSKKKGSGNRK